MVDYSKLKQSDFAPGIWEMLQQTPAYYVCDLGWLQFVPNPACCAGCDARTWDMFLTLWLAIGEDCGSGSPYFREG